MRYGELRFASLLCLHANGSTRIPAPPTRKHQHTCLKVVLVFRTSMANYRLNYMGFYCASLACFSWKMSSLMPLAFGHDTSGLSWPTTNTFSIRVAKVLPVASFT